MKSISKWATIFFLSTNVFFSFLLVEAVVLMFIHQFTPPLLYFSLIPAFILSIFLGQYIKKDINVIPNITVPAMFLIFLISLLLIFYPHDTFGGRDEAIYINTASHLANTASPGYPSYLNDLRDKFVESVGTIQPAYFTWLAIQQNFFDIQGLLRGNLILIILGLSSFFLTSLCLVGKKMGLIATILFSSCMPFIWFSRETMSENLSFFLLWSLILFFFLILKSKRLIYIIMVFVCSWLFALTRLEGFLLQFLLLLIVPSILLFFKSTNKKNIIYITLIFFFVVVSNILISRTTSISFLNQVVPTVNYSLKRDISALFSNDLRQSDVLSTTPTDGGKVTKLYDRMAIFFANMLAKYNFFLVIFSIFFVSILFFFQRKRYVLTKTYFFVIVLILIPEFYKLISPGVTIDEPWLYRRYMYALLPFGYLSFCILLIQFVDKKYLSPIFGGFLLINIVLSGNVVFLKNNWGLINKLETISNNFSSNDFVIIKDRPLGNYNPFTFLVLKKGIRSEMWFNLDMQKFIPENKTYNGVFYNKIFLLSPNKNDHYPPFKSNFLTSENVEYTQIMRACELNLLGEEIGLTNFYNIGILPFSDVMKYCGRPGNKIVDHKETLYLYELLYDKI